MPWFSSQPLTQQSYQNVLPSWSSRRSPSQLRPYFYRPGHGSGKSGSIYRARCIAVNAVKIGFMTMEYGVLHRRGNGRNLKSLED